jgi:eukaryotic-like serine/threonine-protein kinase
MESQGGRLSIDKALEIIFQVLEALDYAHHAEIPYVKLADGGVAKGRGLVHRDLKPANIFLTKSGKKTIAKVGDYGLAKAFDLALRDNPEIHFKSIDKFKKALLAAI